MAQLSLYMDDAAMAALRADAHAEGKSISAYARDILEQRNDSRNGWTNGWPPGYFDLFGSSPEFPRIPDPPVKPIAALDAV